MKKFKQKFIGLFALVFTMIFNGFAQDLCSCSDLTNCFNQYNSMSTDYNQANSLAIMYENYYNEANQEVNDLESQISVLQTEITQLQAQLDAIIPEDGIGQDDVDAAFQEAFQEGVSSVTPEDGIGQDHVDAAYQSGLNNASPLSLDINLSLPAGWSLFGYNCLESRNVIQGFSEISDKIEIIKDEMGLAYLPAWEFSAFNNLEFGEGYQIKMIEEVSDFQFCPVLANKVIGCTDSTSFNYNVEANTGDGSCIAAVNGCIDEGAFNYNPEANTDDNSCIEVINGCIDESALNYDALANTNDGCEYPYTDATISFTGEYYFSPEILWEIRDCNGTVLVNGDGSYQNTIQLPENYIINMSSPSGYGWDDAILNINESSYSLENGSYATEMIGICFGAGCTDESAENYNSEATVNDGSCEYDILAKCAQFIEENPTYNIYMDEFCEQVVDECREGNGESCDLFCEESANGYYEFGSCGCGTPSIANSNCPDSGIVVSGATGGSYTYYQSEIGFVPYPGGGLVYDLFFPNAENITLICKIDEDLIFNIYYQGSEPDVNLITESGSGTVNLIQQ